MKNLVADGIRNSIESKGLYQKYVAERAGFTEQQFSDMLNGRKVIRAEYIPGIANAIGIDISALYAAGKLNEPT